MLNSNANIADYISILEHCADPNGNCTECFLNTNPDCFYYVARNALYLLKKQDALIEEQEKKIKELEDKAKRSITLEFNDESSKAIDDFFVYYAKKYHYPPYDKEGVE